jgi:hypothetical protein
MKIKEWAEEDRPREKMLLKGIASLSDAELLAILIGSGNSHETAVQLSQRILFSVDNNLNALGKLSVKELMSKFKGIGQVKAITINAALELGKRRGSCDPIQQPRHIPPPSSPALRPSARGTVGRTHQPLLPGHRKGQNQPGRDKRNIRRPAPDTESGDHGACLKYHPLP